MQPSITYIFEHECSHGPECDELHSEMGSSFFGSIASADCVTFRGDQRQYEINSLQQQVAQAQAPPVSQATHYMDVPMAIVEEEEESEMASSQARPPLSMQSEQEFTVSLRRSKNSSPSGLAAKRKRRGGQTFNYDPLQGLQEKLEQLSLGTVQEVPCD